jgi:hypothetical protein
MEATQVKFGTKHTVIVVLTLATALVHLYLFISLGAPYISSNLMFLLNSLGYLALLAAYFLPFAQPYHGLVRWVFMGFIAVTIVAWLVLGDKTWLLGYVTKLIEIVLLALLWTDKPA